MQRRALLLGLSAVACGPRAAPALPPAPAVTSAIDFIPPDLDVVVRLDLARVKAALGVTALAALARQVLAHSSGGQEPDEILVASLLAAEQVYLGYRPSPLGAPLDRVLAMQGHFDQLLRPPPGFSSVTDLGRDLRHWDSRSAPSSRGGVARIYVLGDRVRAFVSEAEIDAVERTLTGLGSGRRLEPPEEGTLSLAARPTLLARLSSGSGLLRELLNGAKRFTAVADLESDGVHLKAELVLETAQQAEALAGAGKLVLGRLVVELPSELDLRAEAERVLLSARLSGAELRPLLDKWRGG